MSDDKAILTYWDGRGNAEIVRLMMEACGQKYEEKVYKSDAKNISSFDEFKVILDDGVLAFDQLPLLQIDGLNLVQKHAIVRYLARKFNMYGTDNKEATQCDIIMEALLDFKNGLKRDDVIGSVTTGLTKCGPRLERILLSNKSNKTSGGKKFLVGEGLTFVDIILFDLLITAQEFGCDISSYAVLTEYMSGLLQNTPRLAAYMKSDRRYPSPGMPGYFDRVKGTMPWLFGVGTAPPMTSAVWNFNSADGAK